MGISLAVSLENSLIIFSISKWVQSSRWKLLGFHPGRYDEKSGISEIGIPDCIASLFSLDAIEVKYVLNSVAIILLFLINSEFIINDGFGFSLRLPLKSLINCQVFSYPL